MNICADCHAKDECMIKLDGYGGCIRFDDVEYVNWQIMNELYDIIDENLTEAEKNEYEIYIETKNIFIRDN